MQEPCPDSDSVRRSRHGAIAFPKGQQPHAAVRIIPGLPSGGEWNIFAF